MDMEEEWPGRRQARGMWRHTEHRGQLSPEAQGVTREKHTDVSGGFGNSQAVTGDLIRSQTGVVGVGGDEWRSGHKLFFEECLHKSRCTERWLDGHVGLSGVFYL